MELAARHLIFHASMVLLLGLLCGIPYAKVINRDGEEVKLRAWRVAHLALPIGAILMLAIAAVMTQFLVATNVKWAMAIAFIISGYGFCFALILAPFVGHRGISSKGPFSAKLVYVGNSIGAWFSLAGTILLMYAAFVSL